MHIVNFSLLQIQLLPLIIKKPFLGHGWVGIMFQAQPGQEYNEIVLHVKFKENDTHFSKKR